MEGLSGYLTVAVVSYLIGNLNFSIIFSKLFFKKDIRNFGSGNAGSTNTFRTFGPWVGTLVLICDIAKGVLAVYLSKYVIMAHIDILTGYVAGLFAALGHIYPVLFKFKGGKGVAVIAGMLLINDWQTFLVGLGLFLIILFSTNYMSVASMSLSVIIPTVIFLYNYFVYERAVSYCTVSALLGLVLGLLIIYTHRSNIKRLKEGTESKLFKRKNKNG